MDVYILWFYISDDRLSDDTFCLKGSFLQSGCIITKVTVKTHDSKRKIKPLNLKFSADAAISCVNGVISKCFVNNQWYCEGFSNTLTSVISFFMVNSDSITVFQWQVYLDFIDWQSGFPWKIFCFLMLFCFLLSGIRPLLNSSRFFFCKHYYVSVFGILCIIWIDYSDIRWIQYSKGNFIALIHIMSVSVNKNIIVENIFV